MTKLHSLCVCGTTKIGERGQVVIPAEIRKKMRLKNGDNLLVFLKPDHFIGLIKADRLDYMLNKMTGHITELKKLKKSIKK